jgi:hypothetical protein
MKEVNSIYKFNSLTEFHRVFGLAKPLHPLISFIDIADMTYNVGDLPALIVMDFYKIAYKPGLCGNAKYGQNYYDFAEGGWCLHRLIKYLNHQMARPNQAVCCLSIPTFSCLMPSQKTLIITAFSLTQ